MKNYLSVLEPEQFLAIEVLEGKLVLEAID
jgi:hypothetical protein